MTYHMPNLRFRKLCPCGKDRDHRGGCNSPAKKGEVTDEQYLQTRMEEVARGLVALDPEHSEYTLRNLLVQLLDHATEKGLHLLDKPVQIMELDMAVDGVMYQPHEPETEKYEGEPEALFLTYDT